MTKKKIQYLISKRTIRDIDVYSVIKEFFKEYLQVDYEFTFEELHEELKKIYVQKSVKDKLLAMIQKFQSIEYQDDEIPQEVLQEVLSDFSSILNDLISAEPKKEGLLSKIFSFRKSDPKEVSPALEADKPMSLEVTGSEKETSPIMADNPIAEEGRRDKKNVGIQKDDIDKQIKSHSDMPATTSQENPKEKKIEQHPREIISRSDRNSVATNSFISPKIFDKNKDALKSFGIWTEEPNISKEHSHDIAVADFLEEEDNKRFMKNGGATSAWLKNITEDYNGKSRSNTRKDEPIQEQERKKIVKDEQQEDKEKGKNTSMEDQIKEIKRLLRNKEHSTAKVAYKKLLNDYEKLDNDEKSKHYNDINEFYKQLK